VSVVCNPSVNDLRNFKCQYTVDREMDFAGCRHLERASRGMGEARGRPYDLDTCGSLSSTDERSSIALQSIR
jgi:hypothetical protein